MVRICIWGDSITWGARLPFRTGWANLFRNYLEGITEEYIALYDLGVDCNNTNDLLKRFDVEAKARNPNVVLFAIGTNDSVYIKTKDNPLVSTKDFENNLLALIRKAKKFTSNIVFVGLAKGSDDMTKPLRRSTTGKCYDKENIQVYNKIIKDICKREKLLFIDIYDKLFDEDFDDGLHPNIGGHMKIFEEVRRNIDKFLKAKTAVNLPLVDESNNIIGSKKLGTLNKEDIYRVSALWLINSKNEILISKRSNNKRKEPGKFGPAVAKRVENDESYNESMKIALKDKLGLSDISFNQFKMDRTKTGKNNFFCQWFSVTLDKKIKDFKIDKDEIEELKWISKKDLLKLIKEKPYLFVDFFERYFNLFYGKPRK